MLFATFKRQQEDNERRTRSKAHYPRPGAGTIGKLDGEASACQHRPHEPRENVRLRATLQNVFEIGNVADAIYDDRQNTEDGFDAHQRVVSRL